MQNEICERLYSAIEANKDSILEAERYIWNNPEAGFKEWKTHRYLKALYEKLGYEVHEAGDIPGFYVDIDTGIPGPRIAVFGELDGLPVPDHPERDPETNVVHACGHNAQSAALYALACAFASKDALKGLCGGIRLIAVPAEELVDISYRKSLMEQGILHFYGGKQEFMYRGYLNGIDMSIMIHCRGKGFGLNRGCNGCINKKYTFIGKTAHAAGPSNGLNALYAATNAISSANAVRETFPDSDKVRVHSVITKGGEAVNVIPSEVEVETMVRGLTVNVMKRINRKINRAFAAGALSMGCGLVIDDMIGYLPRKEDKTLQATFLQIARTLFSEEDIHVDLPPAPGCTDLGDVSAVMPVCHAFVGGFDGAGHSAQFRVTDPYTFCVTGAKLEAGVIATLLSDGGKRAKEVIDNADVLYGSVEEYLNAMEDFKFHGNVITENKDGSYTVTIK